MDDFFINRLSHNNDLYIGYPPATDFHYSELSDLLNYSINNLGDPENLSNAFSSHEYEKEVIRYFLNLYGSDYDKSWGYVSHCGTEAALNGCWLGRKYFDNECIIIASEFAHYSIDKISDILNTPLFRVKCDNKGVIINYELEKFLKKNSSKSIIFFATLGSTITSSIDDLHIFKKYAEALEIDYYIHADAAFDGSFLPFTQYKYVLGEDFDSMNISGHKFIGSPMPSGIFIVNKKFLKHRTIEYVKNDDLTIAGSRNGISSVFLYHGISNMGGVSGMKKRYESCLEQANNILNLIHEKNLNAWKHDHALTIVLDKVDDQVMKKWHAPTYKSHTTITSLPKTTLLKINQFIDDILSFRETGKLKNDTLTLYPEKIKSLLGKNQSYLR